MLLVCKVVPKEIPAQNCKAIMAMYRGKDDLAEMRIQGSKGIAYNSQYLEISLAMDGIWLFCPVPDNNHIVTFYTNWSFLVDSERRPM